jgi:hypothetical protein
VVGVVVGVVKSTLKILLWFALCFWPLAVWGDDFSLISVSTIAMSGVDWDKIPDIHIDKDIQNAVKGAYMTESPIELQILRELQHSKGLLQNNSGVPCPCGPNNTGQNNCLCAR